MNCDTEIILKYRISIVSKGQWQTLIKLNLPSKVS